MQGAAAASAVRGDSVCLLSVLLLYSARNQMWRTCLLRQYVMQLEIRLASPIFSPLSLAQFCDVLSASPTP